jgi:hypothetical protein
MLPSGFLSSARHSCFPLRTPPSSVEIKDLVGNNVPNRLHRHAISPCPSNFVDPAEQFSSINSSGGEPIVEFGSYPIRNWNCPNVSSFVKETAKRIGVAKLAPHDLRRTCARLCHASGGELEQIQFLLGRVSVQTTERYLGCKQRIRSAVNDRIGIEPDP